MIVKYSKYTKHPKGPEILPRAHENKDDGTRGIESAPREFTKLHLSLMGNVTIYYYTTSHGSTIKYDLVNILDKNQDEFGKDGGLNMDKTSLEKKTREKVKTREKEARKNRSLQRMTSLSREKKETT